MAKGPNDRCDQCDFERQMHGLPKLRHRFIEPKPGNILPKNSRPRGGRSRAN